MPRPRFNNLTEERRSELLERAANEFALHGYEGGSLNNIITGIGLSKGAFYYYFDDKADLFGAVIEFAAHSLLEEGDLIALTTLERDNFWQVLEELFSRLTARLHDLPWLVGLGKLFYHPPTVDGIDEVVARHFERVYEHVGQVLERGREVGVVRTDEPLELLQAMLMGALEGCDRWFVDRWHSLSIEERERMAMVSFAVVRRMVARSEPEIGVETRAARKS